MKKLLSFLFVLLSVQLFANTQRLVIPKLAGVVANTTNNSITLIAYCIDAARTWPEHNAPLPYIFTGAGETYLTMKISSKTRQVSLFEALEKKYVEVKSYMPPGSKTGHVQIVSTDNKKYRLYKLNTQGFATGETNELTNISAEILSQIPQNNKPNNWEKIQRTLHENLLKKSAETTDGRYKVVKDFKESWIDKDPFFKTTRNKDWDVKIENNVIKIHDNSNGKTSNSFARLRQELELGKELEDEEICVNIGDTSLTVNIAGTLKGKLPIKIEYSSEDKLLVSGVMKGKNSSILISSETIVDKFASDHPDIKTCDMKLSGTICFPLEASSIKFKVCDVEIGMGYKHIEFGF